MAPASAQLRSGASSGPPSCRFSDGAPAVRRAVAEVVRSWRRLTGGRAVRDADRRTLIACSGGADSSALLLALASSTNRLVVAHILHDLRPSDEARADADAARALADHLGLPFRIAEVAVRNGRGNAEARARRARYDALARLAAESGCPFIAVGHHAGDQAETILMGLLRGAGPRGLAGAAEAGRAGEAMILRPMLRLSRTDAEAVCLAAGWAWREDATNRDTTRLRAAVRHSLLPTIERLRPGAARRLAGTAALMRDAARVVEDRVRLVWEAARDAGSAITFDRADLAAEHPIVIGEAFRAAARRFGGRGLDRMGRRALGPAVRAVGDDQRRPRRFAVGSIHIRISSREVTVHGSARRD